MPNTTDIFAGLHVLLISEDESRTQALGKVLREQQARVGNLKISARDPIALRGADVLVIDTRSAQRTQPRVNEMRADVRARWASVINLDFAKVVSDSGAVQFAVLENAVAPVTAADRALTERARKEQGFSTELLPLGPTRVLRALGMAGTTLQVEFTAGQDLKASLTLSNELLVNCFLERGGTRWEAWKALARVLGLSDATVTISRLQHPSSMNIMEPLDHALQTAAQERATAAAELRDEEPSAIKPERKDDPAPANPFNASGAATAPVAALAAKDFKVQPGRTIMGIAPTIPRPPAAAPAAAPSGGAPAAPAALPNVASAKPAGAGPQPAARPMGGSDLGKPGRTIMGIAPGALPGLGAFGVRRPAPQPPPQPEPVLALTEIPGALASGPAPSASASSAETKPQPEISKVAPVGAPSPLLDGLSLPVPDNSQDRELMPTMPAPAPSEAELHYNEQGESRVERIDRISLGDTPTDPAPPRASQPHGESELEDDTEREETTAITDGSKIDQLREEAARISHGTLPSSGSTLGEDFDGFVAPARNTATKPFDAQALARAAEPMSSEDGSEPLNFSRDESQEETMAMERPKPPSRKGRMIAVALLACFGAGGLGYMSWSRSNAARTAGAPAATQTADAPAARAEPSHPAAEKAAAPAPLAAQPAAADQATAAAPSAAEAQPSAAEAAVDPSAPAPEAEPSAPEVSAKDDGNALEALLKDGARLLAEKNPSMAKPLFEAAVSRDPRNPHAQAGLGQALLDTGEAAKAQTSFEAAVKLRPRRARYRVQLGDALKAQGKLEEARAAWEKALEIDPNDREAPKRLSK